MCHQIVDLKNFEILKLKIKLYFFLEAMTFKKNLFQYLCGNTRYNLFHIPTTYFVPPPLRTDDWNNFFREK